ncbi:Permease of the drug/metabolite transporter (DMT) superfamily [Gemmobacter megaterium]|uniref:Permease of the drug/metabolite transporter (DMT) superfamily n=1 Tax=Gemmobacter megaterium TaxID=1086013 RepID=A0A1N7NWR2_9RHOB|nr:DMT family transporter [Gemmobacter megaterium]GGE16155.1 membrane protein [Gemmobacter megaterium]SIT02767.1 Permease of the drug/metabolite transporter (DMT) superfamily [Gemmobacter megaterium]
MVQPVGAGRSAAPVSDNIKGAGFMLVAMAAFILGDACMKVVIGHIPLYQAVTLRGVVTVPLLLVLGRLFGGINLTRLRDSWRVISLRTAGEIGATLTFFYALVNMPLGALSAILQSAPLAVTAGAALFMGEKVGWRRGLAIVVGFAGVLLIVQPGTEGLNMAAVVALISVGFIVVRDLSTRRLPADVPSVGVALVASVAVMATGAVLSLGTPWQPVPLAVLPILVLAAVLVNIGYIFIIRVMRVGEVGFTTPFRYTALVWAMALGWLIWGEVPRPTTLVGAAIVVASGLFVLLREAQLGRTRRH